jgi:hypothetical protein
MAAGMAAGIAVGVTAGGTAAIAFAAGKHSTLKTRREVHLTPHRAGPVRRFAFWEKMTKPVASGTAAQRLC